MKEGNRKEEDAKERCEEQIKRVRKKGEGGMEEERTRRVDRAM